MLAEVALSVPALAAARKEPARLSYALAVELSGTGRIPILSIG
jgi:hypothetical protein